MVDVRVEDCSKLIGHYEATDQGKVEGLMSIDGELWVRAGGKI